MKKTRTRENDAVFFMLLGLTAVFFCWRCRYGFAEADEAFYPTIAYRLTQGDRLLVDEWHMSQLSSVLLYLPVLLFTRLTGGTAGIYLALRYLYVAVQCIGALLGERIDRSNQHVLHSARLFLFCEDYG